PNAKTEVHDRLLAQDAPFTATPRTLVDLKTRFRSIEWGKPDVAIVVSRWWKTRHETRTVIDPTGATPARAIIERNYQDQFN
ncbi:hypothetical protein ABTA55_19290, partial [Acinetobacter baumannii]